MPAITFPARIESVLYACVLFFWIFGGMGLASLFVPGATHSVLILCFFLGYVLMQRRESYRTIAVGSAAALCTYFLMMIVFFPQIHDRTAETLYYTVVSLGFMGGGSVVFALMRPAVIALFNNTPMPLPVRTFMLSCGVLSAVLFFLLFQRMYPVHL